MCPWLVAQARAGSGFAHPDSPTSGNPAKSRPIDDIISDDATLNEGWAPLSAGIFQGRGRSGEGNDDGGPGELSSIVLRLGKTIDAEE